MDDREANRKRLSESNRTGAMEICMTLVVSNYPPEIGSAARLFAELSDGLARTGCRVTVVTPFPRKDYAMLGKFSENGQGRPVDNPRVVRVRTLAPSQRNVLGRALEHFALGIVLPLKAMTRPADVLLVYSPPLPLAFGTVLLAKVKGSRSIVNVQDIYPQTALDAGMIKNGLSTQLMKSMARWVYRHADRIVTHSEGNADYVSAEGAPRSKLRTIHNWADLAVEKEVGTARPRDRTELKRPFVVLYAGIMSYHQDLETLVHAAALLEGERSVRFVLVGDGPARPRIQRLIEELSTGNIVLEPPRAPADYAESLTSVDLATVMLRKEVSTPVVPSKLLDIMASGTACIAVVPLTSDAARIVTDAGCGVVVEPGNPAALASAVITLFRNPVAVRTMGAAGKDAYVKRYSFSAALESYKLLVTDTMHGLPPGDEVFDKR